MLGLVFWIVIFAFSLFVLVKSADYFTDSAENIGLFFGMPHFLIGVTIVALGTSIPELATSIVSVFKGAPEIVTGTVIGSNIANILLVLGLAAIISKGLKLEDGFQKFDKPFLIISALAFLLLGRDGVLTIYESGLLLALYILYIVIIVADHRHKKLHINKKKFDLKQAAILGASAVFIYFSAEFVIKSVINISEIAGFGKEIIAASVVAFGTSMPELTVSLTAIRKSKHDLAVGNIIGSNIFNTLAVIGVSGMFVSLPLTQMMSVLGMAVMLLATFLALFILRDHRMTRAEGLIMVSIYVFFIAKLFGVV